MKQNYGYRQMLRDRMPKILSLALMWCKAKERWIEYVYNNKVKKYDKEKRSLIVKQLLGIKQLYKRQEIYDTLRYSELVNVTREQVDNIPRSELFMKFSESINFTELYMEDPNMYLYWKSVAEWVDWFSMTYASIENTYNHSRSWKISDVEIRAILMDKYKIDGKLADYLIKSFK